MNKMRGLGSWRGAREAGRRFCMYGLLPGNNSISSMSLLLNLLVRT